MQTILITGSSGFIGSHVVDKFLCHGFRVRLTGRSQKSCLQMLAAHEGYGSAIETMIVEDITRAGAFDDAVKGVDGVIHMASPFTYKVEDNEKDLILPAVSGTVGMLRSIVQHAPKVRRVVLTSSFAAINDFSKGLRPGHTYDESEWNPITYQQTKDDTRGLAYAGSKTLAERAAWQFMLPQNERKFTLSTINPVMVFGPPLEGSVSLNHLGQSCSEIYALMDGSTSQVPRTTMPVFADVRDVAEAHLLAYESAESGRFAICAGSYSNQAICQLFDSSLPMLKGRIPRSEMEDDGVDSLHYAVSSRRAQKVLGLSMRSFEDTFLDMAKALLKLHVAEHA